MLDEIKSAFTENKTAICAAAVILIISLIMGYFLEPYAHSYLNPVVENLSEQVHKGVIKLTFLSIFSNNIRVVFMMFFLGAVCCFSALILAFNGFFAGYYVATSEDFVQALLLTVPHGIFEFSSCILACASGFVLFNFIIKFLKNLLDEKNTSIRDRLSISFNNSFDKLKHAIILLLIASVLMAIAGFIEVYLTVPIADLIYPYVG